MAKRRPGWKTAGSVRVSTGRRISSLKKDKLGRFHDAKTGRIVSAANAARRKGRLETLAVERYYNPLGNTGTVEAIYRVQSPQLHKHPGTIIDSIADIMRRDGHTKLPKKGKRDQVRFFAYIEGAAVDDKTGKRVRAGTGTSTWYSTPAEAVEATKDKVQALLEGKPLANDPHKTTGSGAQRMRSGPDSVFITAVYGAETPVPGLDWFTPEWGKKKAAKKSKRKGKRGTSRRV